MSVRVHPDSEDRVLAIRYVDGADEGDIDRGRDICDDFERDVAARADAAMADCRYAIPPDCRAAWYDRFLLIAAVELTDEGGAIDGPVPY